MKSQWKIGQCLYLARVIPGANSITGDRVAIIESYEERGAEPRHLVANDRGQNRFYVYESDLAERDPIRD